jgi:hypothetical protein
VKEIADPADAKHLIVSVASKQTPKVKAVESFAAIATS